MGKMTFTSKLRHSRWSRTRTAMMMFKFHKGVNCPDAAAVACTDSLGHVVIFF
jgi:hypothetical protein